MTFLPKNKFVILEPYNFDPQPDSIILTVDNADEVLGYGVVIAVPDTPDTAYYKPGDVVVYVRQMAEPLPDTPFIAVAAGRLVAVVDFDDTTNEVSEDNTNG